MAGSNDNKAKKEEPVRLRKDQVIVILRTLEGLKKMLQPFVK